MEMENKIKQIVQEFLEKLQDLEEEKYEKIAKISKDDPFEELQIVDKYADLINDLHEKYAKELEKYVDEVTLEFVDDYNIEIGKQITNTDIVTYYYNLPLKRIYTQKQPIIDENKTPFTYKLVQNINWSSLRPTWVMNIHKLVTDLAMAEHKNKLNKAIREVEKKLSATAWIYDYQHFQKALQKTKAEIIKQ